MPLRDAGEREKLQGFPHNHTTNKGIEDSLIGAISPMARGEGEVRLPFSCI
jgi:hypothetical protein